MARSRDSSQHGSNLLRHAARYAGTVAISAAATVSAFPLQRLFEPSNIVMLFLLAIVVVALLFGRGPAVLAAVANVLAFDWFFVPPRFTLVVADAQYVFTFAVMLVVGLIVGQLTAGLRQQASLASAGEERARRLFEMARELSAAVAPDQVTEIGERFVAGVVKGKSAVLRLAPDEVLQEPQPANERPAIDMTIARWCVEHGEPSGTDGVAFPECDKLYLPLKAPVRTRGVLVAELATPGQTLVPEQRRLLETSAALIAIALERVHFVTVAQRTLLDIESERLRNSVLSALSHDLRTPLTSLVGLAETLALELARDGSVVESRAKALAIRDQARRTALIVENLLDMARLQSGRIVLRRDWQSMEELIGSALRSLEDPLRDRPLEVDVPADLPLVTCDAVLIDRVLSNLVENATKYTPPGSPIRISARKRDDFIEIAVEDRGPGLPAGRERAIFDKFTRGDIESSVPGVGLGLAICRSIVEAHGGMIRAENRTRGVPGEAPLGRTLDASAGARFVFTLPSAEPPPAPAETDTRTINAT